MYWICILCIYKMAVTFWLNAWNILKNVMYKEISLFIKRLLFQGFLMCNKHKEICRFWRNFPIFVHPVYILYTAPTHKTVSFTGICFIYVFMHKLHLFSCFTFETKRIIDIFLLNKNSIEFHTYMYVNMSSLFIFIRDFSKEKTTPLSNIAQIRILIACKSLN